MRMWLKEIREAKKIATHEEAAELCGISRSYYTHLENGTKTPTVEVAKKIGEKMGFPWTNFFNEKCSFEEHKNKSNSA